MNNNLFIKIAVILGVGLGFVGCQDFTQKGETAKPKVESAKTSPDLQAGGERTNLNPNDGPFEIRKMMLNLGLNVFYPKVKRFEEKARLFRSTAHDYCTNAGVINEKIFQSYQLEARELLLSYQNLAAVPFGPLIENQKEIFDKVYSFPYLNTCGIDQNVLAMKSSKLNVDTWPFNLRGLGAIEYLVFEESLISKCNLRANPKMRDWNTQLVQDKKLDRCKLALFLAEDIELKALKLKNKWSPDGGDYAGQIYRGEVFSGQNFGLNALSDALFQFEFIKDLKLGRPLGKHKECLSSICPENAEHPYARIGMTSILQNLEGLEDVFLGTPTSGGEGFGMDDLLENIGKTALSDRIKNLLKKMIESSKSLEKIGSLQEQIVKMDKAQCLASNTQNRVVEVCALHEDFRELSRIFKTEVLVALSLRAPPAQQGDND